jgi:hypothetical protein
MAHGSLSAAAAHHTGPPFRVDRISCNYAAMVCVSTRTPTPIVDETAIFFK